jgi:hypothetical protein
LAVTEKIPIITSLSPGMARRGQDGADIGKDYQQACIESWIAQGFSPVTVNSEREMERGHTLHPGATALVVKNDAQSLAGRPLVFFDDILAAAAKSGAPHIAITNADVVLRPGFDLYELISALPPGKAVVAHRTDIARPDEREGKTYPCGFDFFALHRDDLARVPDFGLVFGLPWWDHFLPTMLWLRGVQLIDFGDRFVFHLLHDERWRPEVWRRVGMRYVKRLAKFVKHERSLGSAHAATLECLLRSAMADSEPGWSIRRMIAKRLPWRHDREADAVLLRVSDMMVRFVDERREIRGVSSGEAQEGARDEMSAAG